MFYLFSLHCTEKMERKIIAAQLSVCLGNDATVGLKGLSYVAKSFIYFFYLFFLTRRPLLLSIDYSGTWHSIQY
jgi:hypothetical protein